MGTLVLGEEGGNPAVTDKQQQLTTHKQTDGQTQPTRQRNCTHVKVRTFDTGPLLFCTFLSWTNF